MAECCGSAVASVAVAFRGLVGVRVRLRVRVGDRLRVRIAPLCFLCVEFAYSPYVTTSGSSAHHCLSLDCRGKGEYPEETCKT